MMNQAAALLEPGYMQTLQQFTRIAKQRATLLKQLNANVNNGQPMDAVLSGLEIWTGQFIEAGVALTRMRAHVIGLLAEPFAAIYADLAGAGEQVTLTYAPSFDEVLMFDDPHPQISEHFQRIYPGEVARGVNLIGPQRDDMNLELGGIPARGVASKGGMGTMGGGGGLGGERPNGEIGGEKGGRCGLRMIVKKKIPYLRIYLLFYIIFLFT